MLAQSGALDVETKKVESILQRHNSGLLRGEVELEPLLEEDSDAVHDGRDLLPRALCTKNEVIRIPEQHTTGLPMFPPTLPLPSGLLTPMLVPILVELIEVDVGK